MTIFIDGRNGTRSDAIVEALGEAIDAGQLAAGDRLPTHRAMARQLQVSLGTVTRAYAEAERRGLIVGEVGRGTFVRHLAQPQGESFQRFLDRRAQIDLSINYPVRVPEVDVPLIGDVMVSLDDALLARLVAGVTDEVHQSHHQAGARWMSKAVPHATADSTLLGTGSVTSIVSVLRHLTRPGDVLAVESLTHIQMASIAERLGLRLTRITTDNHGMTPESLDAALTHEKVRTVYCQPTLHCATAVTTPEARRDEIAQVLTHHQVPLIEDDEHFGIVKQPLASLSSRVPDLGVFIADLSRGLGIGLRISYLHVPPAMRRAIAQQLIGTVWMVPPLMAELAARMINDERVETMIAAHRAETMARHEMADQFLGRWVNPDRERQAHHMWLELPKPWRAEQFVAAALGAGVAVTPAEAFIPGGDASPNAVRVCLGAAADHESLQAGLSGLGQLLSGEAIASRGLV